MIKLCMFAGTTEGRRLAEILSGQPAEVTVCVATEYGKALLPQGENLRICAKRLSQQEMETLLMEQHFDLVINATHPYAVLASQTIIAACASQNTPCLRVLREASVSAEGAVFVPDTKAAVAYLDQRQGNILLATGSKELGEYAALRAFSQRVYARVLPMEDSLQACVRAGLPPAHILAMQGPFSREMNVAALRMVKAAWLVTKDTGHAGGFEEKIAAAREAGASVLVVGRPPQSQGLSFEQTVAELERRFGLVLEQPVQNKAFCPVQVTVAGIGPGSFSQMTAAVRQAAEDADCIIGAERMVRALVGPGQQTFFATDPQKIVEWIEKHPLCRRILVAMSGDAGFFSGTQKLLPRLSNFSVEILPGISSLVYLCAKLGISHEDVTAISLHGREGNLLSCVRRHQRLFVLTGGENTVQTLCGCLTDGGMGHLRVTVGENLSYPEEKIRSGTARELSGQAFASLSVMLVEHPAASHPAAGLTDEYFLRGGKAGLPVPMTKSEVRAVCFSKLKLTRQSVCWDVGAGTGSVSIEMALQADAGQVYAIEKRPDALALLEENCQRFGLANLTIVAGHAPEACAELPPPTHVFIGGSSGNLRGIFDAILEKNPTARIVATAISLESAAQLTQVMREGRFDQTEAICLTVARSREAGSYHLMAGQNPVYIFTFQQEGGQI